VRADSESSRRESCATRASRYDNNVSDVPSEIQLLVMVAYPFQDIL